MVSKPRVTENQTQGPRGDGDSLRGLDRDIDAFEAGRRKSAPGMGLSGAATEGYRVLGQMLGGVLGGVGLGWLFDKVVHTSPLGLVVGLLVGSGLSIWSTVHTGSRLGAATKIQPTAAAPATDDEDEN